MSFRPTKLPKNGRTKRTLPRPSFTIAGLLARRQTYVKFRHHVSEFLTSKQPYPICAIIPFRQASCTRFGCPGRAPFGLAFEPFSCAFRGEIIMPADIGLSTPSVPLRLRCFEMPFPTHPCGPTVQKRIAATRQKNARWRLFRLEVCGELFLQRNEIGHLAVLKPQCSPSHHAIYHGKHGNTQGIIVQHVGGHCTTIPCC